MRGPCGTYAGTNAHTAKGEPPCPDCKRARTEYAAAHRFRTGFQHDPKRCKQCGSAFPEHMCGGSR